MQDGAVVVRRDVGGKPKPDLQAIATAERALHRAQGRVDADRRAHSPGCVAVDQKGVVEASGELAHAQAEATLVANGGGTLAITA